MLRKNKLVLYILIVMVFILSLIYLNSPIKKLKLHPSINGSFIQLDLAQNWKEDDWNKEMKILKDNNMSYLVITDVATTNNLKSTCVYNSNISNFQKIYKDNDPLSLCLKSAEKFNIKVFVGTYFNSEWWQKSADDSTWLYSQINILNKVCDELYAKYHFKYPKSFYGWYFPYEVDNAKFTTKNHFEVLANAINLNLDHLTSKKQRLPILMSPFMNSSCGSAKEYADNWTYMFSKTNFKKGDVFCPQDCIGSGKIKLDEVNHWFTTLKKAVDTKPELSFWANIENFDYVNSSSATLNRIISQMKLESTIVENILCFSFNHYYSPNNIDSGFQEYYSYYLKKGKLPNNHPDKPKNLIVTTSSKNEFILSWQPPDNKKNICGYEVYRNGMLIFNTTVQRKYGGNSKGLIKTFVDKPLLSPETKQCTYEVKSFDFGGNLSESSNLATVNLTPDTPLLNNLSKGCSYKLLPAPHPSYSDTNNKLTDGSYSKINSIKDNAFLGWYNDPLDITIDIGSIKPVQQFAISYLRDPISWAELPSSASIGISSDGVNFEPIGLLRIPSVPFSDRNGTKYKIYLTLDNAKNARYIKLTSITSPSSYTFIDEFEVRSN